MIGTFFTILFLYLLVRFVFGFVIPVVSTYLKMKKKMKGMNDFHSTSNLNKDQQSQHNPPKAGKTSKADYIDFEEIK